jgi:hypothetical protein
MKKIIALLVSSAIFASSFAQGNSQKNRHNNSRDDRYSTTYQKPYDQRDDSWHKQDRQYSSGQQKANQIQRLNREYQYKMMAVENNRYMNKRQKKLAIRDLQREKIDKIRMINARYNQVAARNYDNNGRQRR